MTPSHEDQGTGYDPAARGYELQGRKSVPTPDPTFDPAFIDSRPKAPPAAPAGPPAAQAAQDGPEAPEPAQAIPEPPAALLTTYPENDYDHPSRLPPAARPVRQGN